MNADLTVFESKAALLPLSPAQATLLDALGRQLASQRSWWGSALGPSPARSIIQIDPAGPDAVRVTFRDVVGVVRLGKLQIHVLPKIPFAHFRYLAERSTLVPRSASSPIEVGSGDGLVEILAGWFLDAAERLLRIGLRKDYQTFSEALDGVRGQVRAAETAMHALSGQAIAVCDYEELCDDAPLNRLVRAACTRLERLDALSAAMRQRARHVAFRMDGVGPLQPGDLRVAIDRLTKAYAQAASLAVLILTGCASSMTVGRHPGMAFLLRTPELIEAGLRTVLTEALPKERITKRKVLLGETGLAMNPDLVFPLTGAIGDIKYRYLAADWNRADLNQVVAFATAFRASKAVLLGFTPHGNALRPRSLPIGAVYVAAFGWNADPEVDPAYSASALVEAVASWLTRS